MALPDPTAYWPFDESFDVGPGAVFADASGNGHTGTGINCVSAIGKYGKCIDCDGATAAVSFVPIGLGTSHTVAMWIHRGAAISNGVVVGGTPGHYGLFLSGADIYYSTASGVFVTVPTVGLGNAWHHICVSRTNTSVQFYQDGVPVGAAQTLSSNAPQVLSRVGAYDTDANPYDRLVDDLRLYTVAFSAAQVTDLYALDPTTVTPGRPTSNKRGGLPPRRARIGSF